MRVNDKFDTLDAECRNAVGLAKSGLKLLGEMRYSTIGLPAVFSCLALGAEKLLKLTYGVSQQDAGLGWPSVDKMRKLRHNVWRLDEKSRSMVRKSAPIATHRPDVDVWIERVESNLWIDQFLKILSDYGAGGRFHHLDRLAGEELDHDSAPSEQWRRLESAVLMDADLTEDIDELTRIMRERVDEAFRDWWTMYSRAWEQGVFGVGAINHGYTLGINSRTSPGLMHHDR